MLEEFANEARRYVLWVGGKSEEGKVRRAWTSQPHFAELWHCTLRRSVLNFTGMVSTVDVDKQILSVTVKILQNHPN
jgi:hypothetical protein